jgi:hypothetical protein
MATVGQAQTAEESQQKQIRGLSGSGPITPEQVHIDYRECLGNGAAILFSGGRVIPEEIGDTIKGRQNPCQRPVAGRPVRVPREMADDLEK